MHAILSFLPLAFLVAFFLLLMYGPRSRATILAAEEARAVEARLEAELEERRRALGRCSGS